MNSVGRLYSGGLAGKRANRFYARVDGKTWILPTYAVLRIRIVSRENISANLALSWGHITLRDHASMPNTTTPPPPDSIT
jgi:hypothetical protein